MRITILTYGSRGDVEPFVALGEGLVCRGHQVRLTAPARYRNLSRDPTVEYHELPGNPGELTDDFRDLTGANPLKMAAVTSRHVLPIGRQVFLECQKAVRNADLVVHSFLLTDGGHTLAAQTGAVSISAQLFPVFSPTAAFPALLFPDLPLGRGYRRLTHRLSTWIFRWSGRLLYTMLRLGSGTLPRLEAWPFAAGFREPVPILYAFSSAVVPEPTDWSSRAVITGYWFRERDPEWVPPEGVRSFLHQKQRKVYISLGSAVPEPDRELIGIYLKALESQGLAGLIAANKPTGEPESVGERSLLVGELPHSWLFPQMDAVVHHGGAGTTAAVIRSGVPGLVLPVSTDQFFWGRRVAGLGIGPQPIPFDQLSAGRLTAAVREIVSNQAMRSRARDMGVIIQQENGVQTAVDYLETFQEYRARKALPQSEGSSK